MGKKKSDGKDDLSKIVDDLIDDVGEDRQRLVDFLEDLISNYGGEKSVGIAEYVAKLADALTRQNQVRVATLKTLEKRRPEDGDDDDLDDIHKQIGQPFEDDDLDKGAN